MKSFSRLFLQVSHDKRSINVKVRPLNVKRGWPRNLTTVGVSIITAGAMYAGAASTAAAKVKSPAKPYAGQTIIVDWASPSPALSQQFTNETGIKVKWVDLGWDAEQQLIATSAAAHTYFADVTDVDWSKVGEYYQTKWFVPLNKYFNIRRLQQDAPQLNEFVVGGQLVGVPVDASFMVTTVNKADLTRAGIQSLPKTFAVYNSDLALLQKRHIATHPLGIPLSAAEGLSTYWYETTAAMGGHLFGAGNKPLFANPSSPGYKAMAWMVHAYKSGLIPREMINMSDTEEMQSELANHRVSSLLSDYSANVAGIYNDPKQSKVVGQMEYIPTPGVRGQANLGNPDGLGIPVTAKHVGAAAMFLQWFTSSKVQEGLSGANGYKVVIAMPMRVSSMQFLAKEDKNPRDGWAELVKLFRNVQPVFPGGGPAWYSQFSSTVYTNIHSAALGSESVDQAIQAIVSAVNQLNAGQ